MSFSLGQLPLLERISEGENILLVGAGGGFDIFAGLPLYSHLKSKGKTAHLASLSFSELKKANGYSAQENILRVDKGSGGEDHYFPERYLSQWFDSQGEEVPLYCFSPAGAQPVRSVYQELIRELELGTIVLVDGGTDSLMRGDEPGLGSPAEDLASIVAAAGIELPHKFLVILGFGVDAGHGVCHAYVLEAMAELTANGGYLGGFSLLPGMPELEALRQAVEYVHERMPQRKSIVMSSVLAAAYGKFGQIEGLVEEWDDRLLINPLMSMYFGFELDAVAERCLYRDYMEGTYSRWDVNRAIGNFLYVADSREWKSLPF